jgi:hypothetical protein
MSTNGVLLREETFRIVGAPMKVIMRSGMGGMKNYTKTLWWWSFLRQNCF